MSQPAFDFDLDGADDATYGVAELAEAVNLVLRRGFPDGVWVRGEIQGWNERGGHAYFKLVEETTSGRASLNVALFAGVRARMRAMLDKHGIRLTDGLKVRISATLDVYAPSGQLSLKMTGIDPRFTLGDLAAQRADVVRRLIANGLYDANRSIQLHVAPLRIGVVTSREGAAWADFQHEIERSGLGFVLRTVDVRVQGEWAVTMITDAIQFLGRHDDLDAIVVIRGGGARSELATFDDERIATAIARSRLPVLTGIGHETDRSVADEVAHLALKTPTACAAALVERVLAFSAAAEDAWRSIERAADRRLVDTVARLDEVAAGIGHLTRAAVNRSDERLRQRTARLCAVALRVTDRAGDRLAAGVTTLTRQPGRVEHELRHLEGVAHRVRLLDPATTMARGWSITRTADGRTVRSTRDLLVGTEIITTLADGTARSRVDAVTAHRPHDHLPDTAGTTSSSGDHEP
ncbi:MAG: exodeoxyribonuclease large subunit [Actinomycetota bacterium]|jgi:exodeoxyribonuclease VII large subunit